MKPILLFTLILLTTSTFGQINGTWHTSFSIMGNSNRLDMFVNNNPINPSISVTNPDSDKTKNLLMDKVKITDSTLSFFWTKTGISYEGKYSKTGDSLVGVMSQMDVKWEVNFTRHEHEKIVLKRPQEPKAPFAYPVEEILIQNGENVLGATLTLPLNAGSNYPIVVLASGSGAQDRNCELVGHKSFLVIADYFARNGIACLRFDDRGVGKSTGSFQTASLEDFASDVNTCVNYLVQDPRFAGNKIGVAGHSEGGMHALIAAKSNKKIQFIVELASVGTSGGEVLAEQNYLIYKASGSSEEVGVWAKETITGICGILAANSADKAVEPLSKYIETRYAIAPKEFTDMTSVSQYKMGTIMMLNNDWGRQFTGFQAANYLKKIKVPVLAINGSKDIQVPPVSNQAGFAKSFSKKSLSQSKAIVVDGLNHLFQNCNTCTTSEYVELEETFSETVLKEMTVWIKGLH
jgi:pimeloyl-ACP methyl ester carboxylesterase